MPLPVKTFEQFLNDFISTLANETATGPTPITDFTPGSVALALGEAEAGNSISIQQILVHIANITRLATCEGEDVDTFVADYGLTREPAVAATVNCTFSRTVTGIQVLVPVGAIVQTAQGVQYQVIPDISNVNYAPSLLAYVMVAGATSVIALVQAVVPGSGGNATANTITQIVSGITGVSSVTNTSGTSNGVDAETDSALKNRFQQFILSLSKATHDAIATAINGVQAGLTFTLNDGLDINDNPWDGAFTVVVDDGSGSISGGLLTTISAAISAAKALGIQFAVFAPTDVTINITGTVSVLGGFNPATVKANVVAAWTSYINHLGVGVNVSYVGVANVGDAVAGVASITGLTVNSGVIDIPISFKQLARAGTITAL